MLDPLAIVGGLAAVADCFLYVAAIGERFQSVFQGPGLEHLVGLRELPAGEGIAGQLYRSCVHEHDRATHGRLMNFTGARPGHAASAEYRLVGRDGVTRWVHHGQRMRETGGQLFVDGAVRDITLEREAIARSRSGDTATPVEHRSQYDPLTGAANRDLLLQTISEIPGELTVIFLDIDAFKELNQRLGPIAGDDVLRAVADRMRSILRPTDLVARVEADQFVAVCRTAPGSNVYVIVQRLAAAFFEPLDFGGRPRTVAVSIGLAQREADAEDGKPWEVVRQAEESMRADKGRKHRY